MNNEQNKTWLNGVNEWMRKLVPNGDLIYESTHGGSNPNKIIVESVGSLRELLVNKGLRPINELKLNRILKHGENGYIVISANRTAIHSDNKDNDLTPEYLEYIRSNGIEDTDVSRQQWLKNRNATCDKKLSEFLRSSNSPWSFNPVFGDYHGSDNVVDDFEPSYIVYNYSKKGEPFGNFDDLYKFALDVCAKYKQDSVYVCKPGEAPNHVDRYGNIQNSSSSKNYKFNRDNETFYTTTKRDKGLVNGKPDKQHSPQRFTADIRYECIYHKIGPSSYNEKVRRVQEGEYLLDEHTIKTYEYEDYKKLHEGMSERQLSEQFAIDINKWDYAITD